MKVGFTRHCPNSQSLRAVISTARITCCTNHAEHSSYKRTTQLSKETDMDPARPLETETDFSAARPFKIETDFRAARRLKLSAKCILFETQWFPRKNVAKICGVGIHFFVRTVAVFLISLQNPGFSRTCKNSRTSKALENATSEFKGFQGTARTGLLCLFQRQASELSMHRISLQTAQASVK